MSRRRAAPQEPDFRGIAPNLAVTIGAMAGSSCLSRSTAASSSTRRGTASGGGGGPAGS